jgi:hypothetical protein
MSAQEEVERQVLRYAEVYMAGAEKREAMRRAFSDAAHLCDALAKDILEAHRVRGRVTKAGEELAATATLCANVIWALHDRIKAPVP